MYALLSLVKTMKEIVGSSPCKKTVQKIAYLTQEAGETLGFDFSIHFYGPYSEDLDAEMRCLFGRGDLNIEFTTHGHLLSLDNDSDIPPSGEIAHRVISKYGSKNPSELELLATTLYVQREMASTDTDGIIGGVERIKGTKYSKIQITQAISTLSHDNYFGTQQL